ncbi:MAG: Crp/Fnr family transcriptional regulator [Endomicrobiia bacterium]
MKQKNEIKLLSKVSLFSGLSRQNLRKILNITKRKKIPKNKIVFTENTYGNKLYILVSGRIKIFGQSKNRKKIFTYLEPNEFFGELALLGEKIRSASAEAVLDSELLIIEKNDFVKLLKKYPNIALNLLSVLCKRLYHADKEIELLSFQDVFGRIVQILLRLSKQYGKNTPQGRKINLIIGHTELAELAGTVREMVTRALTNLKKLGCIDIVNKQIIILDENKLKKFIR